MTETRSGAARTGRGMAGLLLSAILALPLLTLARVDSASAEVAGDYSVCGTRSLALAGEGVIVDAPIDFEGSSAYFGDSGGWYNNYAPTGSKIAATLSLQKLSETPLTSGGKFYGTTTEYSGFVDMTVTTTKSYVQVVDHAIYGVQFPVSWRLVDGGFSGYLPSSVSANQETSREGERCRSGNDPYCIPWQPFARIGLHLCEERDGSVVLAGAIDGPQTPKAPFSLPVGARTISVPLGAIEGMVLNEQPVELGKDAVEQVTVELYREEAFLRPRAPGESADAYQSFLDARPRRLVDTLKLDAADAGSYSFDGLPMFARSSWPNTASYGLTFYSIYTRAAEMQELDVNRDPVDPAITVTTRFSDHEVHNLEAELGNPVPPTDLVLTPFDGLGTKQDLIDALSKACPQNYLPIENGTLQPWFATLVNGSLTLTPERQEGLKRAIWAERVVRDGVRFSDVLLDAMLKGLGTVMADLFDFMTDFKRSDLAKRQMEVAKIEAGKNVTNPFFDKVPLDSKRYVENLELDRILEQGEAADTIKKAFKGVRVVALEAATRLGMDDASAEDAANALERALNVLMNAIQSRTLKGALKSEAKKLVNDSAKLAKPYLLDDTTLSSYCKNTAPDLGYSVDRFMAWNVEDDYLYGRDRGNVVETLTQLGNEAKSSIDTTTYLQDTADALDTAKDLIELVGKGVKWAEAVAKIVEVIKYIENVASIKVPFEFVYGTAPGLVREGVYESYGAIPPTPAQAAAGVAAGAATPAAASAATVSEITLRAADVGSSLDAVSAALAADDIEAAMIATGESGALVDRVASLNAAVSLFTLQASGVGVGSSAGRAGQMLMSSLTRDIAFKAAMAELVQRLRGLFVEVLTPAYSGSGDPRYLVARAAAIAEIGSARRELQMLLDTLDALDAQLTGAALLPVVELDIVSLTSDLLGGGVVSLATEDFSLVAQVKNRASVPIGGLTARLSVRDANGFVTVLPADVQTVGSGTLAADDLTIGGGDEATLTWTVHYDGDLSSEEIFLNVELLENGGTPSSFVARSPSRSLLLAPMHSDADGDQMPDDWERASGLDPGVDDSDGDEDGDRLGNLAEYRLGTLPNAADSDGDGLGDGDEVLGSPQGFASDPHDPDSDDDGVLDGADGQPLDGSTSAVGPNLFGEPIVALDAQTVDLGPSAASTTVQVSNAGDGTFAWMASTGDDDVIATMPGGPNFHDGAGSLIVYAQPHHDFGAIPYYRANVEVTDLTGVAHDVQRITVRLGTPPAVANDECTGATAITSASYVDSFEASGATASASDPSPTCGPGLAGASVWYAFTAPSSETVVLSTEGSDYETVTSVWLASEGCGSLATVVACDSGQRTAGRSRVELAAQAGTTYLIEIRAADGGSAGRLEVDLVPEPGAMLLALAALGTLAALRCTRDRDSAGRR